MAQTWLPFHQNWRILKANNAYYISDENPSYLHVRVKSIVFFLKSSPFRLHEINLLRLVFCLTSKAVWWKFYSCFDKKKLKMLKSMHFINWRIEDYISMFRDGYWAKWKYFQYCVNKTYKFQDFILSNHEY